MTGSKDKRRQVHDLAAAERGAVRQAAFCSRRVCSRAGEDALRLPPDPAVGDVSRATTQTFAKVEAQKSTLLLLQEEEESDHRLGCECPQALQRQDQVLRRVRATGHPHDRRRTRLPARVHPCRAGGALLDLQELTRRLHPRVPLGPGADRGDDRSPHRRGGVRGRGRRGRGPAKLPDELGSPFQVYFLALLLEEQGAGDLERVARTAHEKLVRRHPHVFADAEARTHGAVRERWEAIKSEQEAARASSMTFPGRCPRCSRPARCSAGRLPPATTGPISPARLAKIREEPGEPLEEQRSAGRRRPRPSRAAPSPPSRRPAVHRRQRRPL